MYLKLVLDGKKIGSIEFDPKQVLLASGESLEYVEDILKNDIEMVKSIARDYFYDYVQFIIIEDKKQDDEIEKLQMNAADRLKAWANE